MTGLIITLFVSAAPFVLGLDFGSVLVFFLVLKSGFQFCGVFLI